MKISISVFLAALVCIALFPQSVEAQKTLYGKPVRLNSLADLDLLDANDLAAPQKTEVLLSWLAAERANPSPTVAGLGGGPIDTDYIQAQITKALETKGDPLAVSWVANSTSLRDPAIRDSMQLVLGSMGDKSQIPAIEKILLNNKNPYLRAVAAEDLGLLGSISSLPTLRQACKDSFSLTFASEEHGGKMATFYPVRQVAEETIRVVSTPSLLAQEKKREQFFGSRLVESRKYALAHKLSPSHFVRIANRSRAPGKRAPGA